MALNVGGFEQKPDFPKMGPSLLIGACLIPAVRTARWSIRRTGSTESDKDMEAEVEHAIQLAGRVLVGLGCQACQPVPSGARSRAQYFERQAINPNGPKCVGQTR